jgi:hypothetical protein
MCVTECVASAASYMLMRGGRDHSVSGKVPENELESIHLLHTRQSAIRRGKMMSWCEREREREWVRAYSSWRYVSDSPMEDGMVPLSVLADTCLEQRDVRTHTHTHTTIGLRWIAECPYNELSSVRSVRVSGRVPLRRLCETSLERDAVSTHCLWKRGTKKDICDSRDIAEMDGGMVPRRRF